jgi:DNA-binding response OmpR family regulator
MRILLVDDELELVETLSERLSLRGFDTEWATSGADALERAAASPFDLAVLDLKMPGIGGIELKKKLMEKYPGMKFIFLTGYGSESEFNTVIKDLGLDGYLVKPVEIEDLVAKLNDVLKSGR